MNMAPKPPACIGSAHSPTGQEFPLWTYEQLEQLPKPNLKTRACELDVSNRLLFALIHLACTDPQIICMRSQNLIGVLSRDNEAFCSRCRVCGEKDLTIKWILEAQCLLINRLGYAYEIRQFGWPSEAAGDDNPPQIFDQQLPSIKMTRETILHKMATTMKPGPNMHDP